MNDIEILDTMLKGSIHPVEINNFLMSFQSNNKVFLHFFNLLTEKQKANVLADKLFQKKFLSQIQHKEPDFFNSFFLNNYKELYAKELLISVFIEYQNNNKQLLRFIKDSLKSEDLSLTNAFYLLLIANERKNQEIIDVMIDKCQSKFSHIQYSQDDKAFPYFSKYLESFTTIDKVLENTQKLGIKNIFSLLGKVTVSSTFTKQDPFELFNTIEEFVTELSGEQRMNVLYHLFGFNFYNDKSLTNFLNLINNIHNNHGDNSKFIEFGLETINKFIIEETKSSKKNKIGDLHDNIKTFLQSSFFNSLYGKNTQGFENFTNEILSKIDLFFSIKNIEQGIPTTNNEVKIKI